jgi:hypothetical protein
MFTGEISGDCQRYEHDPSKSEDRTSSASSSKVLHWMSRSAPTFMTIFSREVPPLSTLLICMGGRKVIRSEEFSDEPCEWRRKKFISGLVISM